MRFGDLDVVGNGGEVLHEVEGKADQEEHAEDDHGRRQSPQGGGGFALGALADGFFGPHGLFFFLSFFFQVERGGGRAPRRRGRRPRREARSAWPRRPAGAGGAPGPGVAVGRLFRLGRPGERPAGPECLADGLQVSQQGTRRAVAGVRVGRRAPSAPGRRGRAERRGSRRGARKRGSCRRAAAPRSASRRGWRRARKCRRRRRSRPKRVRARGRPGGPAQSRGPRRPPRRQNRRS